MALSFGDVLCVFVLEGGCRVGQGVMVQAGARAMIVEGLVFGAGWRLWPHEKPPLPKYRHPIHAAPPKPALHPPLFDYTRLHLFSIVIGTGSQVGDTGGKNLHPAPRAHSAIKN